MWFLNIVSSVFIFVFGRPPWCVGFKPGDIIWRDEPKRGGGIMTFNHLIIGTSVKGFVIIYSLETQGVGKRHNNDAYIYAADVRHLWNIGFRKANKKRIETLKSKNKGIWNDSLGR